MFNLAVRNLDAKPLYLRGPHYAIIGRAFARAGALRSAVRRHLAQKGGVEIKEIYLTSGGHDLLVIAEAPLGDHVTKLRLQPVRWETCAPAPPELGPSPNGPS